MTTSYFECFVSNNVSCVVLSRHIRFILTIHHQTRDQKTIESARLAQSVARETLNLKVVGSSMYSAAKSFLVMANMTPGPTSGFSCFGSSFSFFANFFGGQMMQLNQQR